MSEREKLLAFLFDRDDGKELINLKFLLGSDKIEDKSCAAALRVLERLWSGETPVSRMPSETAIYA